MDRRPAVAGQFYPGNETTLAREVERLLTVSEPPRKALGVIAPHAGYIYSGAVAGAVFGRVIVPKRAIVLCPNHTGMGARAAVWASGTWQIPTGTIRVDQALAHDLIESSAELTEDTTAHLAEHSLEVELPFLLAREPEISIVPIAIGRVGVDSCRQIGESIARVIRATREEVLIVASSDMNHYEDEARTMNKDRIAIERVEALDAEGLIVSCAEHRISMCGVLPSAIAITACKKLGATKAHLVAHATSGDVSGDHDAVVGYAGFMIE